MVQNEFVKNRNLNIYRMIRMKTPSEKDANANDKLSKCAQDALLTINMKVRCMTKQ